MKLWKISRPEYSHARRIHVANNGILEIPFGLPGVSCCVTWSSYGTIEKFLPQELECIKDFKDVSPVSIDRFLVLRQILKQHPDFNDIDESLLKPGFKFRNTIFKSPDIEENDLLWPRAGNPLVSFRIARLLLELCPGDVTLHPLKSDVNWTFLGIRSKSFPPIERISTEYCGLCGRGNKISASSKFELHVNMLPKSEIFILDTTLHIIVTNRLMMALKSVKAKNIEFEELVVGV
jgi:hypothetical protein